MTELVLKKIGKHFGAAPWLERIIGRIVMRARSPKGRPWVWTITAREQPPSFFNNLREPPAGNERFPSPISFY
jgi:hypothetical protein